MSNGDDASQAKALDRRLRARKMPNAPSAATKKMPTVTQNTAQLGQSMHVISRSFIRAG